MTTLAKSEASRRNGALSAGPITTEGKVIVSRNATKHGIFSSVPVLPGECPEVWEAHRAGIVDSLYPVGLLEVNLAERVALLLWRLQRVARYEADTGAAAMEALIVPPLPPTEDIDDLLDSSPKEKTHDEQLRDIRRELRSAQEELSGVVLARGFFQSFPESGSVEPVSYKVAESIFNAACTCAEIAEDIESNPPDFGNKAFMRKLGLAKTEADQVAWAPELIDRGFVLYAKCAGESAGKFRDDVRVWVEEEVEELTRKVRRFEAEAAAITWLLDGGNNRNQAVHLLPNQGRDDRIAKYERHLHSLLTSTLHELERLQARREGEPVVPPLVADVNVTIDSGAV